MTPSDISLAGMPTSRVSHEVRQKAEALFVANNRANGALYPYGFGFLSAADRKPWYEKAEAALAIPASPIQGATP